MVLTVHFCVACCALAFQGRQISQTPAISLLFVRTYCVLTTDGCFAGALISAQRASAPSASSAPAPGGLLASAPAPGTIGDYTAVNGQYTYIVSPNISVPSFSTSAYSYFSGNGSIASVRSALAPSATSWKVNLVECGCQAVRQPYPHA